MSGGGYGGGGYGQPQGGYGFNPMSRVNYGQNNYGMGGGFMGGSQNPQWAQPQGGVQAYEGGSTEAAPPANSSIPWWGRQSAPSYRPQQSGGMLADPRMAQFQRQAPAPQAPKQSFEQFAQTLGNSGMTGGQMQDAYQKSQPSYFSAAKGFTTPTPTNPAIPQINGGQPPVNAWEQRSLNDPQWAWQQMLNQYAKEDAARAPEGPYDAGAARLGLRAQFGR